MGLGYWGIRFHALVCSVFFVGIYQWKGGGQLFGEIKGLVRCEFFFSRRRDAVDDVRSRVLFLFANRVSLPKKLRTKNATIEVLPQKNAPRLLNHYISPLFVISRLRYFFDDEESSFF